MNTDIMASASGQKLKSYWNRPGGKFGVLAGIGILGFIGLKVLPIVTTITWNAINFTIAGVTAVALAYVLSHRSLRMSLFYLYEILMKKLVGAVITLDPFIIAEDCIKDMKADRKKLFAKLTDLETQKESAINTIAAWEREKAGEMNIALRATHPMEKQNAEEAIGRLNTFIRNFQPLKNDLTILAARLQEIYDKSKFTIQGAEKELYSQKQYYNAMTTGRNAVLSALRIFEGDPHKKLMAAQAMDYLKDDLAAKRADMRLAMRVVDDFVEKIDTTNATYQAEGIAQLEQLAKAENFTLNVNGPAAQRVPVAIAPPAYADLLDAK